MNPRRSAFQQRSTRAKFKARVWNRMGLVSEEKFTSAKLVARAKLPSISTWRVIKRNAQDGATFFKLRDGRVVVAKQEFTPYPFSKVGVVNGVKDSTIVLTQLLKKRIPFEVPLGRIVTKEGEHFYITKRVEGVSVEEKLRTSTRIEAIHLAKAMGDYLAKMHAKGVAHIEASAHNWVAEGTKVKMVDAKYILFKEEFPYTLHTGGVLTWEKQLEQSRRGAEASFPKPIRIFFTNAYESALKK